MDDFKLHGDIDISCNVSVFKLKDGHTLDQYPAPGHWSKEDQDSAPVEITVCADKDIRLNIGSSDGFIYIDKLYGPHAAEDIRVSLQGHYDWVIERKNAATQEWETKARWNVQESFPEDI